MKQAALKFTLWAVGTILLLSALVLLTAALGLSWLGGSAQGRAWLAGQISAVASSEDLMINVTGLQNFDTRNVVISNISFQDKGGVFAILENVEIDYAVKHLLAGNLNINDLSIQNFSLERAPQSDADKDKKEFPEIPDLRIENLDVKSINLARDITGTAENMAVSGALFLSSTLHKNHVDLKLEDKNAPDFLAAFTFAPKAGDLKLQASVKDSGQGILSRLSGIPMIDISLEGDGPLEKWQGNLMAVAGESFKAENRITLNLDSKTPSLTLAGQTHLDDYKMDGETALRFHMKTKALDASFNGDVIAPDFTLKDITVKGQGDYKDERINITKGYFKNALLNMSVDGYVDLSDESLELATKTNIPDLAIISPDFTGSSILDMQISGGYAPLDFSAPVQLQVQNFKSPWDEVNQAMGTAPLANADLSYAGGTLDFQSGALKGAALKALTFSGTVSKTQSNLNINTSYRGYDVDTVLNVEGTDIILDPVNIKGDIGTLSGRGEYNLARETIKAALTLAADNSNIVSVKLGGTPTNISYSGDWTGEAGHRYAFQYEGSVEAQNETTIKLIKFYGDYGATSIALKSPTQLMLRDGGATLGDVILTVKDGELKASGGFGKEEFSAQIQATNLPTNLALYPFVFDGRIAGSAKLSGLYDNPAGSAQFDLTRIAIPGIDDSEDHYVSGIFTADYKNNALTAEADLSGPAALTLKAKTTLPVFVSPPALSFEKPVSAILSSSIDLGALSLLLGLNEHNVSGRSNLDLNLSGTLNEPIITGSGNLQNAAYENLLLGTRFENISAQMSADKNRLNLENINGRDMNGGQFNASGHIDFRDIQDPQYDFSLDAKTLQLVNTDRMGITASGTLKAVGDRDAADIGGKIIINQAEYYIDQIISTSSLSSFTIIEESAKGDVITGEKVAADGPQINLSIGIIANNNVFVRGPDLETEWSGTLAVAGSAGAPELKGNLSLVRGKYKLLDTPVAFSKGDVRFVNANPANPDIDITGVMKGQDIDATVNISGEAQSPEISLQSAPPLPEGEILAKTLFGKSMSELSAVQALRIAQLVTYLSGGAKASFDPLNDIRRAIGIDTLSVGIDDEKGATLSAGKYVSDNVYIGVEQGTTPGSSTVRAEIGVTDNIEVETKANSTNENSVGVNWKKDY